MNVLLSVTYKNSQGKTKTFAEVVDLDRINFTLTRYSTFKRSMLLLFGKYDEIRDYHSGISGLTQMIDDLESGKYTNT